MKYPSMCQLLDHLESNCTSIDASSSPSSWLAIRMGKSKDWSAALLDFSCRSAEAGRADLAAYQGEDGKALFEYIATRQAAPMSEQGQALIREGCYPYFDEVAAKQMRKHIRLSDKELHDICRRVSRIAARHANTDEETLLAAFFAACCPTDETLTRDYARAVGYCVGVVREASRQLNVENDTGFAEGVTAIILWTGMVAGLLGGMVILDTLGAIVALSYAVGAVTLLLVAAEYCKEPPEDMLLAFIQKGVIARKSFATSKAVLRHAELTYYPCSVNTGSVPEYGRTHSRTTASSQRTVYA